MAPAAAPCLPTERRGPRALPALSPLLPPGCRSTSLLLHPTFAWQDELRQGVEMTIGDHSGVKWRHL